jgi:hypothetical protein
LAEKENPAQAIRQAERGFQFLTNRNHMKLEPVLILAEVGDEGNDEFLFVVGLDSVVNRYCEPEDRNQTPYDWDEPQDDADDGQNDTQGNALNRVLAHDWVGLHCIGYQDNDTDDWNGVSERG